MNRIAQFEKVSFKQFRNDMIICGFEEEALEEMYNNIQLPKRSTKCSAGYDFRLPYPVFVGGGQSDLLPTGIKVKDSRLLCLCQSFGGMWIAARACQD